MSNNIVAIAKALARNAHEGQVRKYTGEPYFSHCEGVANLLRAFRLPPEAIAAGYLHDTLEDTAVRIPDLIAAVGPVVTKLVMEVTDVSRPGDGNRKVRKELDRQHIANGSPLGKSVKLADLINNTESIVKYDPDFARVYLREKEELLKVLRAGNTPLYRYAQDVLRQAQNDLKKGSEK